MDNRWTDNSSQILDGGTFNEQRKAPPVRAGLQASPGEVSLKWANQRAREIGQRDECASDYEKSKYVVAHSRTQLRRASRAHSVAPTMRGSPRPQEQGGGAAVGLRKERPHTRRSTRASQETIKGPQP